jgi:hypothetical protein
MGIERHHIKEYRCRTLICDRSGYQVQFLDHTGTFAEERYELVRVTVMPQFEKQGEEFLFDAVYVHGGPEKWFGLLPIMWVFVCKKSSQYENLKRDEENSTW